MSQSDARKLCKRLAEDNLCNKMDAIERKMNRKMQKTGELVPQDEFRSRVIHKLCDWCIKTLDRCKKRYLAESDPSFECLYQLSLAIDTMKLFKRL
jgi:hypothetical protein